MKVLLALLMTAALTLAPGDLQLEVAGDGAEGVTVRALGADGRPAETELRLVLTATAAAGGRTIGPVQLTAAAEGRGFYSSGPVLPAGATWNVVVTGPGSLRASAVVTSRPAQSPPPPASAKAAPATSSSSASWWWLLIAGVIAALATGAVLVGLRRSP